MILKRHIVITFFLLLCMQLFASVCLADRIKDVARIQGVRSNQLVGYGLVVGLEGTGDSGSSFTQQSFRSMLNQFGINVPTGQRIDIKNVAAVALSATLPPFMKPGQKIDVTASSIGSASSLRGGTLLMAPLRGADGKVYAIAQGDLIVSGLGASGEDGSKITVNIRSVGRIPNGASVERVVASPFYQGNSIVYNLNQPDFTTVKRMVDAINNAIGSDTAVAMDASSVRVNAPKNPAQRVDFVSVIENIEFTPDDSAAKIVVNSRTGTIVIGQHVRVKPTAISHGNLVVTISENPVVSQPNALAGGETVVAPASNIQISQGDQRMFILEGGTTLKDIVTAVNAVGAAPGDLMAILEALKEIGAFQAELVVI